MFPVKNCTPFYIKDMYYTILCLVIETHGMNEYSDTKVQITWKMRQRHNTKKIDWYSTERCHKEFVKSMWHLKIRKGTTAEAGTKYADCTELPFVNAPTS